MTHQLQKSVMYLNRLPCNYNSCQCVANNTAIPKYDPYHKYLPNYLLLILFVAPP
jgi:hypothetical protein